MDSENGMRCYLSPRLPVEEWCEVCEAKKPTWDDYRKKSSLAGAALRDVLRVGKTMTPNAKLTDAGTKTP